MLLIIDGEKAAGESNREFVYRILRGNIMSLHLPPGLFLFDNIIAEELGVSRTPIREAVFDLVEEHLIDVFPKKRSLISLIDFTLVHEGIFMRQAMDAHVFEQACGTLDSDAAARLGGLLDDQRRALEQNENAAFFRLENAFFGVLYGAVRMSHVWDHICSVTTHYERLRYFDAFVGGMRLAGLLENNAGLLRALLVGDREGVSSMSTRLLSSFPNITPFILEEYRTYFRNFESI